MDTSKLIEIHKQISELKEKSNTTDSKKETYQIEKEIKALQHDFEIVMDNLLDELPGEIALRARVDKLVYYDTWDFKSWIAGELLERDSIEDLDIMKELKTSVEEVFDASYEIDDGDVIIEFVDDEYK